MCRVRGRVLGIYNVLYRVLGIDRGEASSPALDIVLVGRAGLRPDLHQQGEASLAAFDSPRPKKQATPPQKGEGSSPAFHRRM